MEQFWKVLLHSIVIFVLLIALSRIMGRKILSQMTYFDFVTAITIGTITGAYVTTEIRGAWVLVSPVVLTICTLGLAFLTLGSLPARKIIKGEPVVVIQNGRILEKNMLKLRYTIDALEMQLREKGVFNFNDVEFAILEPHGQLSVLKKSQNLPVTPKDLQLSTGYQGMATELIKDGEVLEQNLLQNHLTLEWLYEQLQKANITDLEQVFYANLNTDGTLFIDRKDENLDYIQKVED